MSVDVGSAIAYLDLNTTAFESGIQTALTSLRDFEDNASLAVGSLFSNIGHEMTRNLTIPIANIGQSALDSFKDYESAFAGVKKTVDDAQVEMIGGYEVLSDAIEEMSTRTASTVEEIAGAMEVAGQLGVPLGEAGKDIIKFTETMIQLGDSTNLSSEEAATALARFMNITGTAWEDVDRLGSVIVDLGNNFAAQEDEITYMATRLASAGTIAGLTETEILALATAMTSVGIKAEAGGTAMSTTLAQIEKAVAGYLSGEEGAISILEKMAEVAGMSADEFIKAWEEEPIKALQNFLVGVGALEDKGESAVIVLDELGMSGVRQSNMLKALGLAAEELTGAIDLSNKAWEENTALTTEAEKRYETLDSKLSQLNEEWKSVQRDLAEILIPLLEDLMDVIKSLIEWWRSLSEGQQKFIVGIAAFVAALGPLISMFGNLLQTMGLFKEILNLITKLSIKHVIDIASSIGNIDQQTGKLIITAKNSNSIFSSLGKMVYNFFNTIGSVITKVISSIGSVVSYVISIIQTISGIAGIVVGGITAISSFFTMLSEGFSWANEAIMLLGIAITALGAILLGAPAFITSVIAAIVAAIATLIVFIKDNWEDIKNWLGGIMESILEWLGNAIESISNFLTELIDGISKFLSDVGQFLSKSIENFVTLTGEMFVNILTSLGEFIMNVFDFVVDLLSNIKNNFLNFAGELFNSIISLFSGIVSRIVDFFMELLSIITNGLSNASSTVSSIVWGIITTVINFLGDLISFIVGWFFDLLSKLPSWLGSIFDTVVTFFGNLISSILDFLSNIFFELSDWFEGLGLDFLSWGFNLIGNFLSGLKSGWETLVGWIKSAFGWLSDFVSGIFSGISGLFSGFGFNGSHLNGLDYVPYDGYIAQLHEGERVLTKQEAKDYNDNEPSNNGNGDTFIFYDTKDDPYEYARQIKRIKKELAELD